MNLIKIGDLIESGEASLQTGPFGTQLKASEYVNEGVPVINVRNIGYGSVIDEKLEYVNNKTAERLKIHVLRQNDIVFGRKGAVDRHALIDHKANGWIQGSDCLRLRLKAPDINNKFVSYYFCTQAHKEWMEAQGSFGATMSSLNQDIIKRISLPQTSLTIQKKIAAILSTYDDLIENNKRRITILERMAEEIYREWFIRFRYPGYKKGKTPKGVSTEWNNTVLTDIIYLTMGQSPKSEFYNQEGIGLPFHQGVGNFGDRFPAHNVYCSVKGRIAEKGSILFSVRAPVGRLNIADRKLIIGRGLAAMKHRKGLNTYLYYMLRHEFSKEDIIGNGAIFNSVGKDELANFRVLYNDSIAELFNGLIEPIDKKIELLNLSNFNLRHTRDLFLSRLLSGKLSVEDLDIQFPQSMEDDYAEFHQ